MFTFDRAPLTPISKQECIPVGCVLPATVAICWGGVWPGDPPGVGLETLLGVGLETPWMWARRPSWVWAWRPPWVWAWRHPQARPPNFPPPLGVAWRPARHARIPPLWRPAARHAGIPPAMYAGIPHPPVNRMTDRQV